MGAWEFVFLAYGIVWSALLLYFFLLKHRSHAAEAELTGLVNSEVKQKDA